MSDQKLKKWIERARLSGPKRLRKLVSESVAAREPALVSAEVAESALETEIESELLGSRPTQSHGTNAKKINIILHC